MRGTAPWRAPINGARFMLGAGSPSLRNYQTQPSFSADRNSGCQVKRRLRRPTSSSVQHSRMLAERDLGRKIRSSRQTLGQYLDHWLNICAEPRLRAKSFRDYSSLLARYVHDWAQDRSESFRRRKARRSTTNCSIGSCPHARFATRTRSSSRRCGRLYVGNFSQPEDKRSGMQLSPADQKAPGG